MAGASGGPGREGGTVAGRDRRTDRTRKDGLPRYRGVVALLPGGPGAEGPDRTDAHLVGRQPTPPRGLDGRTRRAHRFHAPRPWLRGAGPGRAPRRRVRRRTASFAMGRSRRASAGRDQPSRRHRLAYPHGPRPADDHPLHTADVRLPSAVPGLRVESAVRRRCHDRRRQPGSARRGAPREASGIWSPLSPTVIRRRRNFLVRIARGLRSYR